jgi:outer membrane protein TolC
MIRRVALVLLFLAQPGLAVDIPDRVLSLDDSVRLAQNNSPALLSVREDVNIALQRVRQAQSLFFPRLDLNANWSKFRVEDGTPLLLQPAVGPTLVPANPRQNFYSARANIYQSLYEGGRSQNLWRQASISYERAKSASEERQSEVTANAKHAFFDLLFVREKKRFLLTLMTKMERVKPSGSILEQIKWESAMSELRDQLTSVSRQEQGTHKAYLQTLNLELNTTVLLQGKLETHPIALDRQKLLAWSTQYRSELKQTEYQQELDALGVGLSLAERRPTIGLGASYERTGHDIDLPGENWAGTLNINLPVSISDFVYGWAKVRERRAQYRQATLRHVEVSDQIQLQVRQAYDQYELWQAELTPRLKTLERMEELQDSLRRQAHRSLDTLEAEKLVLDARVRYLEAVHGHLTALAALERAVGKPLSGE